MFRFLGIQMFLFFGLFIFPVFLFAQTIEEVSPDQAGEVYVDETIAGEQIFLGALQGSPHLYVVTLKEAAAVKLNLRSRAKDQDAHEFSIILVRDLLPRGVEAVARLRTDEGEWEATRDADTRVRYRVGHQFSETLPAGTYRVEVSNSTNIGQYELRFGEAVTTSWWNNVQNMRTLQRWYGTPWWQSLLSPLWYIPISVMLLLGISGWWGYRRYTLHGKTT